jgi:hypothetical protein
MNNTEETDVAPMLEQTEEQEPSPENEEQETSPENEEESRATSGIDSATESMNENTAETPKKQAKMFAYACAVTGVLSMLNVCTCLCFGLAPLTLVLGFISIAKHEEQRICVLFGIALAVLSVLLVGLYLGGVLAMPSFFEDVFREFGYRYYYY